MTPNKAIEIQRAIHPGHLLGEGGMGRVIEGFAPDLGQHLAIKQLRPEWMEDGEVRARFEEEASIMASIDHPGVLPVYGIGLDDERRLFYVMKKVEGSTLGRLMADTRESINSVPRRKRLVGYLLDVCETLAVAHEKGIVHRDLKPDNILVDRASSVYVIDWGIAKRTGTAGGASDASRTLPGRVMGTPGYMAPEQADGRSDRVGAEADVFALGVILYEILTSRRPFAADEDRAEMLGAIHNDPEPPRRANWLLPRDISAVCLKALHKNPARRYPDAGSLADDLRAHLEGRSVGAIRPNVVERVHYAAKRNPLRATIIASAISALAILTLFISSQRLIDQRIASKAMKRLATMDAEISEIESEQKIFRAQLATAGLTETERARVNSELKVNDARWILAQFEAHRILNSVAELRFLRSDPGIHHLARQRLVTAIEASIDRGNPALGEAVIATYLERAAEGTLVSPLSDIDLERMRKLADKARAIRQP